MNKFRKGWWLISLLLAIFTTPQGTPAQAPTTTVQDTIYRADGTPAGGSVILSWNAFTTANGSSIPAGTTTLTIGAGGALTAALVPNANSTPMGNYYTAVLHLNDGTVSREFWVIPITVPGGGPAKLAGIRNQVLPTSVAMQTVSKEYVDRLVAGAQLGPVTDDNSPYVEKAGDAMTGPLQLPADPASPNQAADKHYVDTSIAAVTSGLSQKVSILPTATQVVAQPTGTDLEVNRLNGTLYADQFTTGSGSNGLANALADPACTTGCRVIAEPSYNSAEQVQPASLQGQQQVVDQRQGSEAHTALNPLAVGAVTSSATSVHTFETLTGPQLKTLQPAAIGLGAYSQFLQTDALTGGSNLYPESIEAPPYGKSTYGTQFMLGHYYTQGQHIQSTNEVHCYAVGDCLAGSQEIFSAGGYRDSGDEGEHPFDLQVSEDPAVYTGTCATGCTTGSTSLTVTSSQQGTQGDGRFLIDLAPARAITTGTILSGSKTIFGTVAFSGTSFPVSVFLQTAAKALSQPTNIAPGTVTLALSTSGVPAGFSTNTAALPATTGLACIADEGSPATELPNYEIAPYTVVDATHIQLTLNKTHNAPAAMAVGGLCGYGLEQTADTTAGLRQLFPVLGATDATDLYYIDAITTTVGRPGTTTGFLSTGAGIASASRTANVTTITTTSNLSADLNGLTLTIAGVADSSYNGTYTVTTTAPNAFTYANTGSNSTSSGGSVSFNNGAFALYPIAEVLSVMDPANKAVDGTFTLAPNTVAWAAGDPVEQPHYFQMLNYADTEFVTQYLPRPVQQVSAGKTYVGQAGPGLRGWQVTNAVPDSNYLGAGGTHTVPDIALGVIGPWATSLDATAGTQALVHAHCNLHGCNRYDSAYDLFLLDSAHGTEAEVFDPASSTVAWNLQGNFYSFSPSAFTAPTINVGTLNATTITGGVSGSAITGIIPASHLPVFGPSGTTHAAGIVPDPGATAGNTRFLREDGTFAIPAGSGGGGTGAAGGDLSGSYPAPTVSAVHATSGTLNGVIIGATTPAAITGTTLNVNSFTATCTASMFCNAGLFTSAQTGGTYMGFDNTSPGGGSYTFGALGSATGPQTGALVVNGGNGSFSENFMEWHVTSATSAQVNLAAGTVLGFGDSVAPTTTTDGSTASAAHCNQGGTLSSVAGCLVYTIAGATRYVPYF